MDKYDSEKAAVATTQPHHDALEEPIEGKAIPVKHLSSSWIRDILLTVETTGIQRVTEEERQQNTTKVWNACTFW